MRIQLVISTSPPSSVSETPAKDQSHLSKNSHRTIKTEVGMGRCLFLCRKVSFPAGGWRIWPKWVSLPLYL